MRCVKPKEGYKDTTKICKLCFQFIPFSWKESLLGGLHETFYVCPTCYKKFQPHFRIFKMGTCKGLAIYDYDEFIQSLLYQCKGRGDIEVASLFMEPYARELRLWFQGYVLVPMPSSIEKEQERGFSHVEEIFKPLKLPFLPVLKKVGNQKQSALHRKERWKNREQIQWNGVEIPPHSKILLVDDVMSSGATFTRAIEIVQAFHPRKIKILVMSKNDGKRR